MSPHEQQVETYMGYMKTQIQLIPCENWYQFTIDNMRLVQSYVVRHSASTGHHAAPNQSELYTQSSSQGYRIFPSHRYSQLSTLTPMSPLLSVSGGSEHQKPYIQSPYRSFPTGTQDCRLSPTPTFASLPTQGRYISVETPSSGGSLASYTATMPIDVESTEDISPTSKLSRANKIYTNLE
ncbi:uncharacterized protein LOC117111768 [Anneissia japonica]|uniref:uncharacterized protein LOC117111768 n=1 Tax=Anneissia japonica TaxID=1529436 RepID=UPI001425AF6D|nr:uncharacterized protein LOC117111768 [Anneissia japonica]